MGAVDNPLFAEDDFSAFAPEDGVQAPEPSGWHGEPTGPLQPPSPLLDAAQREKLRASRRDRRDPGGRERRDGQRRRALEAKNEALEQEVSSLRRASETRADEALATRAKALRHLEAAEDHVGLLVKESAAKLETLAAEKENDATSGDDNGRRRRRALGSSYIEAHATSLEVCSKAKRRRRRDRSAFEGARGARRRFSDPGGDGRRGGGAREGTA
jgi:hypothetical protein